MHATTSVVRGLHITVTRTSTQFDFFAVVLLATFGNKNDDVIFIKFGEMAHAKVTVSLVVEVAVTVTMVVPGTVVVSLVCVTPAENVAV